MPEAKTVDNLGIEPSIRWALDQERVDLSIVKEAPFVSKQTVVDVAAPTFVSEFDLLFQTRQRFVPWASFSAPPGYNFQTMRIFTHQVIPSIGPEKLLTAQIQKIKDKISSREKARLNRSSKGTKFKYPWEEDREKEEEHRESQVLIHLLDYLNTSDAILGQINARRNQYSKG